MLDLFCLMLLVLPAILLTAVMIVACVWFVKACKRMTSDTEKNPK